MPYPVIAKLQYFFTSVVHMDGILFACDYINIFMGTCGSSYYELM